MISSTTTHPALSDCPKIVPEGRVLGHPSRRIWEFVVLDSKKVNKDLRKITYFSIRHTNINWKSPGVSIDKNYFHNTIECTFPFHSLFKGVVDITDYWAATCNWLFNIMYSLCFIYLLSFLETVSVAKKDQE